VGDAPLRKPITGIAGCCVRVEIGQAAAAPPSTPKNARRQALQALGGSSPLALTALKYRLPILGVCFGA